MDKHNSLKTISFISFAGLIFSGVLSYRELFMGSCQTGFVRCGVNTGPIAGVPACVFGFVMYLVVFVVSLIGYKSEK